MKRATCVRIRFGRWSTHQRAWSLFSLFILIVGTAQPAVAQTFQPTSPSQPLAELQRSLHRPAPHRTARLLHSQTSATQTVSTIDLPALADTYIASGRPDQNFGADSLYLGY